MNAVFLAGLLLLLSMSAQSFAADRDNDGLADEGEASLGTSPDDPDTDGDGQTDGAEVRAGTDPRVVGSVFRILARPVALPGGGFSVEWSSTPGKSYKLQRTEGDTGLGPPATWRDVVTVQASGTVTSASDSGPAARRRFYRVMLLESSSNDQPPTLRQFTAAPTHAVAEGIVTLSVVAEDDIGMSSVSFYSGARLLGLGESITGGVWRLSWPIVALDNGTHSLIAKARDTSGNSSSLTIPYAVTISTTQTNREVGVVQVRADNLRTEGENVIVSGTFQAGAATIESSGSAVYNPTDGVLTGSGKVNVPGLGTVITGAFSLDANTGILSAGTGATLAPILLSSGVEVHPSELKVDVNTGAFQAQGALAVGLNSGNISALAVGPNAVQFNGGFTFDPVTRLIAFTGVAGFKVLSITGQGSIDADNGAFALNGVVSLSTPAGQKILALKNGRFGLAEGELSFGGEVQAGNFPALPFSGKIDLSGVVTSFLSEAEAHFGDGIRLYPTNAPVLSFMDGDLTKWRVHGNFNVPWEAGVQSIEMGGQIQLGGMPDSLHFALVEVTNRTTFSTWKLPANIQLGTTAFRIALANQTRIAASMHSSLAIGGLALPVSAELAININDPSAISVDAETSASRFNIHNKAYLQGGKVRLLVQTKPIFGQISLSEAAVGLFPKESALSNGIITTNRELAAVDFQFFASNVQGFVEYAAERATFVLNRGALGLPTILTTAAAGECDLNQALPNQGTTPSVALGENSALRVNIPTTAAGNGSISLSGSLTLANFGFQVPNRNGGASPAALKLCSARLVFNGPDLPHIDNLSGKLWVKDLGLFTLDSGYLDPRGQFSVEGHGSVSVSGLGINVTSLKCSYLGGEFLFRTVGDAVFGGTVTLKPKPQSDVLSVRANASGEFEVAAAGIVQVGAQHTVELSGVINPAGLALRSAARLDFGNGIIIEGTNNAATASLVAETNGQFKLKFAGDLLLPSAKRVSVSGSLDNQRLTLRSTGIWTVSDGIRVEPLPGLDVVTVSAASTGQFEATVAGKLLLPLSQRVEVRGRLSNTEFTLSSSGNLELGPGIVIRNIGLEPAVKVNLFATGVFEVAVAGELLLPNNQFVRVSGKLNNNTLKLTSTGRIALASGVVIEPADGIEAVSVEAHTDGTFVIRFGGRMQMPSGEYVSVTGGITNDQLNLQASAAVHFGNGVWLRPLNGAPVMSLLANANGTARFRVSGEFLAPSEGQPRYIAVTGELAVRAVNEALVIESFSAAGDISGDLALPAGALLGQGSVQLSYAANVFSASLSGALKVGRTTASLDRALLIFDNSTDAANIRIDAEASLSNLPLEGVAHLSVARARLQLATSLQSGQSARAGFARLELSGSGGIFPKGEMPQAPARTDFYLFIENLAGALTYQNGAFSIALTNGTLRLPDEYFRLAEGKCPDGGAGPTLQLGAGTLIQLAYTPPATGTSLGRVSVTAQGSLNFANIGVAPPGTGLTAELCSARLVFGPDQLPRLEEVSGIMTFPTGTNVAQVDLRNGLFTLQGYPSGRIELGRDLILWDQSGFKLRVLGAGNTECQDGAGSPLVSGITVFPSTGFNNPPKIRLDGGVRFEADTSTITHENGDVAAALGCGTVILTPNGLNAPPTVEFRNLTFGVAGSFRLGGRSGVALKDGTLVARNLENIFRQSEATPVILDFGGKILVPNGPGFGLRDMRLVFTNALSAPRVDRGTLLYEVHEWAVGKALPFSIDAASITFKEGVKFPDMFRPENLIVRVSASLGLPSQENPIVGGRVDEMQVSFESNGQPRFSLQGIGMEVGNITFPPIEDMGGKVYLGGLHDPEKLFFAGKLGGKYNGMGVQVIVAFNKFGPIGACVDFNAGSVGIPIDGGYLGGVYITGASAGISFMNSSGDPCEFGTYLDQNGQPLSNIGMLPEVMNWEHVLNEVREYARRKALAPPLPPLPGTGIAAMSAPGTKNLATNTLGLFDLPCPDGCPPPSVNIFCQPHPDAARFPGVIIAKFSSIDEQTLNSFGIDRNFVNALYSRTAGNVSLMAADTARQIRQLLFQFLETDISILPDKVEEVRAWVNDNLNTLETNLVRKVEHELRALNQNAPELIYQKIVDIAYAGAPCPDITLKVTGTMTHSVVSSFLSGTGGAVVSSTGHAGVLGQINVLGVPVGRARGFIAVTDSQGDPNPSLCAHAEVEIGPLHLGNMAMSFACEECVTGMLRIFGDFANCLSGDQISSIIRSINAQIDPRGKTPRELLQSLNTMEKLQFLTQLTSNINIAGSLDQNGRTCLLATLQTIIGEINPDILYCAEVKPKLFGFPMALEPYSASGRVTKSNLVYVAKASPSSTLASAVLAVAGGGTGVGTAVLYGVGQLMPVQDTLQIGYTYSWPDPVRGLFDGIGGKFNTPEKMASYLDSNFDAFLQDAVMTFDYEMKFLGFKFQDTEMRYILPNVTAHPSLTGWIEPERRGLPARTEVLMAALNAGKLANPFWKGSKQDLFEVFPVNSPERLALAGRSFQDDYFPHGGAIAAGRIFFPLAFTEAAPEYLFKSILNSQDQPLNRLSNVVQYVQGYILESTNLGTLALYSPAPNPPALLDGNGRPLPPRRIFELANNRRLDGVQLNTIMPTNGFFFGEISGRVFGIPLANGKISYLPPQSLPGIGQLDIAAESPSNSWLNGFVENASLRFRMFDPPTNTIPVVFSNLITQLQTQSDQNAAIRQAVEKIGDQLPKGSLELQIQNLRIPKELTNLISLNGNASARLVAFSPLFNPLKEGTGPLAEAERMGGIALEASVRVANVIDVNRAQFRITPRGNGVPLLEGLFNATTAQIPGLGGLENIQVAVNSEPAVGQPFASVSGSGTAVTIDPLFTLRPVAPATKLAARFDTVRTANGLSSTRIGLSPAQLHMPFIDPAAVIIVDGGADGKELQISTASNVTSTNRVRFVGHAHWTYGGVKIFQANSLGLSGELVTTGFSSGSITVTLPAGAEIVLLPDHQAFRRLLRFQASGSMIFRSDGTFAIKGKLLEGVSLDPLAGLGLTLPAGIDVELTDQHFKAALAGAVVGSFGAIGAEGSAQLRWNINTNVPLATRLTIVPTITGRVSADPFRAPTTTPVFEILPATAGQTKLTLDFTNQVFQLSGAKARMNGIINQELALPALAVNPSGSFTNRFGPLTANVPVTPTSSFGIQDFRGDLVKIGTTVYITNANLKVALQGWAGLSTVTLNGNAGSDGAFTFEAVNVGAVSLAVPGANAWTISQGRLVLDRSRVGETFATTLQLTGSLGGGLFSAVNFSGSASGSLSFTPAGGASLDSDFLLGALQFDRLRVVPTTGSFAARVSNSQIDIGLQGQSIQIQLNNTVIATFPLDTPIIATAADLQLTKGAAKAGVGLNLLGVALADAWLEVKKTNNTAVLNIVEADLRVPLLGFTNQVAGAIYSDSRIDLSGSVSSAITIPAASAPLATSVGSATARVQKEPAAVAPDLFVSGSFSGGLLNSLSLPSGTGQLRLYVRGSTTELGGSLIVNPLRLGAFSVAASGGAPFNFSASNTSLSGSTGIRVSIDNVMQFDQSGAFNIPTHGTISHAINGAAQILGHTFRTFQGRVSASLPKGQIALVDVNANFDLPVVSGGLTFTGSIQQNGQVSLVNSLSGTLPLFGSLRMNMNNALSTTNYASMVRSRNPEFHFRFNDSPGDKFAVNYLVVDEMGRHTSDESRTLDPKNPIAVARHVAGALAPFDSDKAFGFRTGTRIELLNEAAFDVTGPFTVEAWVKADGTSGVFNTIVSKGDSAWRLQRDGSNNRASFDTDGLNPPYLQGTRNIMDGQWHHVVGVYDGAAKYLYVDGFLDGFTRVTGTPAVNNFAVCIGENMQQRGRHWIGSIDEPAFYKAALTPHQVALHYAAWSGRVFINQSVADYSGIVSIPLQGIFTPAGVIDTRSAVATRSLLGAEFGKLNLHFTRNSGVAQLRAAGEYNLVQNPVLSFNPLLAGNIVASGAGANITMQADDVDISIAGYRFADVDFKAGPLSVSATTPPALQVANAAFDDAALRSFNFPALNGDIPYAAGLNLQASYAWQFGPFASTGGKITLKPTGLEGSGTVSLGNFGGSAFSGGVRSDGVLSLTGASSLSISGRPITSVALNFNNSGVNGSGTLDYGDFRPRANFSTADNKLRLSASFSDVKGFEYGGFGASFGYTINFAADSGGSLSAKVKGQMSAVVAGVRDTWTTDEVTIGTDGRVTLTAPFKPSIFLDLP